MSGHRALTPDPGLPTIINLFHYVRSLRLPKSNAGPPTILCDELNTGFFQRVCFASRLFVAGYRPGACLKIRNGTFTDLGFGEVTSVRENRSEEPGRRTLRRSSDTILIPQVLTCAQSI